MSKSRFFLSNPMFFPYFLPKVLERDNVFPVTIYSLRKREIKVEINGFNIVDFRRSVDFLTEGKYRFYQCRSFFKRQEFSLGFNFLDPLARTFIFSKRIKRLEGYSSLMNFLKEKDSLLGFKKRGFFLKTRVYRLVKGGFVSSCLAKDAFVIKSSLFHRFRDTSSYKSWFSLNLSCYGLLSYFLLLSASKKFDSYLKRSDKRSFSKRVKFYYFKNEVLNYVFLLGKPRKVYNQLTV